ncbi:hypothetical protein LJB89_02180, partial [Tyzzerella sp. OttesenSCG-928-J15]|nr:hypothetical protein [Tyzzerella sp. OttesenSCG-928-J15]
MKKLLVLTIISLLSVNLLLSGCSEKNASQEETTPAISEPAPTEENTPAPEPAKETPTTAETDSQGQHFFDIQQNVDSGQEQWRLAPEEVALKFAEDELNFKGTATLLWLCEKEAARVAFTKQSGEEIHIDLYQPALKGEGGIWDIECWFDENNRLYQIRDLAALPELFYNDEEIPENVKEAVRDIIVTDWTETFSLYYDVLGFYADSVTYTADEKNAELKFIMTIVTKNFYKDPDTVGYIKEAKDKNSENYQQLYDEYNMP